MEKLSSKMPADETVESLEEVIHELQVHQVELDMQNESLREAQSLLEKSKAEYEELYESAPIGYYTSDERGAITKINETAARMLGMLKSDISGKSFSVFCDKEFEKAILLHHHKALRTGKRQIIRVKTRGRDKRTRFLRLESVLNTGGDDNGRQVMTAVTDITELAETEERLKQELEEKNLLLKELHHRVNNNLAIINGLLTLHARGVKDEEVLELFRNCKDRIRSIALVHELLHRTENLTDIDIKQYVEALLTVFLNSHRRKLDIRLNVKDFRMEMDKAIPAGMIINELATNVLKHAYKDDGNEEDHVMILDFGKKGDNYELRVEDRGQGLPEDFDIQKTESLGLKIVQLLVSQLRGTIKIIGEKGTEFCITFPEK